MSDPNGFLRPEGPGNIPRDDDDLRVQIQALAEFIQDLKQHAERSLGHLGSEKNEQDQSERDRRWKESQARWEEMQRDIERRLDALEGRSSEGSCGEEGTEREGPRDG